MVEPTLELLSQHVAGSLEGVPAELLEEVLDRSTVGMSPVVRG
jgi:hypothetical protein